MMTIRCPFCDSLAHVLDWQSICTTCFRRWETEYTDKLREEYKGGLRNGKKSREEKTET